MKHMTHPSNYIGVDLHKKTCYITVMDKEGEISLQKEIPNKKSVLTEFFSSYAGDSSVVVESTLNWMPFFETVEATGCPVGLSNPLLTKAVAAARKLCSVIFAMLTDKQPYREFVLPKNR